MIEVTQPFEGAVQIKFSTGLRVSIRDDSEGGKPRLEINAAGHGKDGGHDAMYIRPGASNTVTLFFDRFTRDK